MKVITQPVAANSGFCLTVNARVYLPKQQQQQIRGGFSLAGRQQKWQNGAPELTFRHRRHRHNDFPVSST